MRMSERTKLRVAFGVMALMGGAVLGAAVVEDMALLRGSPAMATVDHCSYGNRRAEYCYGHWTVDGREASGSVNEATHDDVGRQVSVHIAGGRAYRDSTIRPIAFTALGLAIEGGVIALYAHQARRFRRV